MLAILRDQNLEQYVTGESEMPTSAGTGSSTSEVATAISKWKSGDAKARTRIELSIGDSEMVHLSGAQTAREMWYQLCLVYENTSGIGLMVAMRTFYRLQAEDDQFDIIAHVAKFRKLHEDLHTMNHKVDDAHFILILLMSLPTSWENYCNSYLVACANKPMVKTHKIIALLYEEDRRRKEKGGADQSITLQA